MQLKKTNITGALLAASCSLLGSTTQADDWNVDTAIMYYGEQDRVSALEGVIVGNKTFKNDAVFNAKFVIDSLTGASANGAVPQNTAQTFTRPSGNGQYQAEAGEIPLDDTFKDTRGQLDVQWTQPFMADNTFSTGIHISAEHDYQSVALNGMLGRDFNQKNTSVSLGLSYAMDVIDPVGGQPVGLSEMVVNLGQYASDDEFRTAFDLTRDDSADDTKNTLDVLLGVTQVINRRWITQFNFGISEVDGYQTGPYKVVSVVDASGTTQSNLYEQRPDTRSKHTFFAQSKYQFSKNIWDFSYRYAGDDWGITSHTLDTRYRIPFGNNNYIEPHVRYYQQSEADFYTPFLVDSEATPEFASADYRIGKMDAYTFGIKYGKKLSKGHEYGVRLEYYSQVPKDVGKNRPGQLQDQDLFPKLDALILQFNYSF
ncbi:DUF3570 domain-containing protein [Teredinibacter sp. KSP-S5-2]|uniref:DUF3570 domain-containing protein n=1 Tax=Teredinibacter sp. KSP-S5-2 TaxID=3034506 RepID=UPI002934F7F1|nr:DUF3570 domain-containing protein [Teredinibacter sp. KSP-S5-2]WNO10817.1 DUF3570 domain-containing protein [Teredinibacter sp. KSP-S5-2]